MLEEALSVRWAPGEARRVEVFALEVAKPGLGLTPHTEGTPCTLPASVMDENKYPQAYPPYKSVPPHCGVFNRELSRSGERRFEMLDVTGMQQIADSLHMQLAIVDQTGLEGRYDAVLEFGPDNIPPNTDPANELGLPLLPTALQKQLGLKLEKQKAQIDVFVIDHINATVGETDNHTFEVIVGHKGGASRLQPPRKRGFGNFVDQDFNLTPPRTQVTADTSQLRSASIQSGTWENHRSAALCPQPLNLYCETVWGT